MQSLGFEGKSEKGSVGAASSLYTLMFCYVRFLDY